MTIMRQIRAASRIAVTWGVAFAALGATTLLTGMALHALPPELVGVRTFVDVVVRGFAAGFVGGTVFSMLFARAERNRTLATLSTSRVALWGFLGACVPAAITLGLGAARLIPIGVMGASCLVSGLIGGSLGIVMLKIAKRAPAALSESALPL
jgi:hypothetical protein